MRTFAKCTLGLLLVLGGSSPAWSLIIVGGAFDGTDVGGIDTYKAEALLANSGEQTELNWVNGELGTSFTSLNKQEDVDWYDTNQANVIAFQLFSGPGYYLVKNANLHVLFQNVFSFDWGVINLNDIQGNLNLGSDMQISHVSGFGSTPTTQVPAPATLTLLGAGLLGMGLLRRRRFV